MASSYRYTITANSPGSPPKYEAQGPLGGRVVAPRSCVAVLGAVLVCLFAQLETWLALRCVAASCFVYLAQQAGAVDAYEDQRRGNR